jgi:hypothetical protein
MSMPIVYNVNAWLICISYAVYTDHVLSQQGFTRGAGNQTYVLLQHTIVFICFCPTSRLLLFHRILFYRYTRISIPIPPPIIIVIKDGTPGPRVLLASRYPGPSGVVQLDAGSPGLISKARRQSLSMGLKTIRAPKPKSGSCIMSAP